MRHNKKFNHLGRTSSHRKAMLANMACSLILHKRIETTVAKAKALRVYVEPLITKCKEDSTHSRRITFAYLRQKQVISELFNEVSQKVANRPGGYTRILKLSGTRIGDNADRCIIELVDYNTTYTEVKAEKKAPARRRRSSKKEKPMTAADAQAIVEEAVEIVEKNLEATGEIAVAEEPPVVEDEAPKAEDPQA
ncbi:MAG: 50S ribosomal protein L17 [Odoribacteraceae bacterium]|nr:50S ribosomal protein L17 [Odoribacteraceae bacterium]